MTLLPDLLSQKAVFSLVLIALISIIQLWESYVKKYESIGIPIPLRMYCISCIT